MKKLINISKVIALLLVCMLPLYSCNKENNDNCPEDIRVYFAFNTRADGVAFNLDIDRMYLYVFSEDGYFLREYRDEHIVRFNEEYYISCTGLMPGNYRFIAWGGKDERYYSTVPSSFVSGATTFNEALLKLRVSAGTLSSTPTHLFHSDLSATVTYSREQRFTMPLAQLSNIINIRTEGMGINSDKYRFSILDNNGTYTFAAAFPLNTPESFTYTTTCTKDNAGQLNASLTVLRLAANRRVPQLQIYNETKGEVLYPVKNQSGNLIDLILKAYPQNNFENTHIYNIVITFKNNSDVIVTVNGWEVKEQDDALVI